MRKKYCFPIFSTLFSAIFSANVYAQDCSGLVLQQDGNLCGRVDVIVSNPDCFERYTYKVTELLSDGTEDVAEFENVNESSKEVVFGTATESFSVTVSAFAQGSPDAVDALARSHRLQRAGNDRHDGLVRPRNSGCRFFVAMVFRFDRRNDFHSRGGFE